MRPRLDTAAAALLPALDPTVTGWSERSWFQDRLGALRRTSTFRTSTFRTPTFRTPPELEPAA